MIFEDGIEKAVKNFQRLGINYLINIEINKKTI